WSRLRVREIYGHGVVPASCMTAWRLAKPAVPGPCKSRKAGVRRRNLERESKTQSAASASTSSGLIHRNPPAIPPAPSFGVPRRLPPSSESLSSLFAVQGGQRWPTHACDGVVQSGVIAVLEMLAGISVGNRDALLANLARRSLDSPIEPLDV